MEEGVGLQFLEQLQETWEGRKKARKLIGQFRWNSSFGREPLHQDREGSLLGSGLHFRDCRLFSLLFFTAFPSLSRVSFSPFLFVKLLWVKSANLATVLISLAYL